MKVCTSEEIRTLDRRAIEEFGIPEELLMESAGEAAYQAIRRELGVSNRRFTILCGVGNNGGDGLVVARKLHSHGAEVSVFILGDVGKFRGAAKMNFDILSKIPVMMSQVNSLEAVKPSIFGSDAVIDALFGTGLTRELDGIYKEAVHLINESGKTVFSIDIPSGINADTGAVMGAAVYAGFTVTFGLPKRGLLLYPGYEHCGKLYLSHISYPVTLSNDESIKVSVNEPPPLPKRGRDSHKGDYGKALFIAGSARYLGAPYFSALSFLKAGGGLSYLATPRSLSPHMGENAKELVLIPQDETEDHSIAYSSLPSLLEFSETVDIVVVGPGLSLNEETQKLVRDLVPRVAKPLIIDGDGITAIATDIERVKERRNATTLTPHIGEMARVTRTEPSQIISDKIGTLQLAASRLNSIIVLKGAHTLIGRPDGSVRINLTGNPGMATAGSGDVLTGAAAAMFGLGLPFPEAVEAGVFIHGLSGDLAAREIGEDGVTAQDILNHLPQAVKTYREEFGKVTKDCYNSIFLL